VAEASPAATGDLGRIWTIPNALSFLRLLGVPVFLWLVLGTSAGHRHDRIAFGLLMVSGFTDWADGQLARRLNQTSRLGALLDPAADRLYIASTILALCIRGVTPWWLLIVLASRDVILGGTLPVLARAGFGPLPVSYIGKAATFNLLYAFPLLLLTAEHDELSHLARPAAWCFTIWGGALYLVSGWLYLVQVRQVAGTRRADHEPLA
jgi:cardiolipin synthase